MSTTHPPLPSAADVEETSGGGKSFRFSEGRIVTGREKDGSLKAVDKLVGRITRVGIHEGQTKDTHPKPILQVECDLETSEGTVYIKGGLLEQQEFRLRPSTSTIHFAWGLLQFSPDDVVQIRASQGQEWEDEMGRERKASTYVNWARVVEKEGKFVAEPVYRTKAAPNAPKVKLVDRWLEMEPQIRALPHFAPRPAGRDDDGPTHLSELTRELTERGWLTPDQAPIEWLALVAVFFDESPRKTLSDYTDDQWGQVRQDLIAGIDSGQIPAMPASLQEAKKRLEATDKPAPRRNAFA